MGNGSPAEPSWRQAWRDLEGFRGSFIGFWGVEVVAALVGTLVAIWLLASSNSSNLATTFYGATGLVAGLGIAFIGMYAFYLLRAPYRQRDEARGKVVEAQAEIDALKARPNLEIVFESGPTFKQVQVDVMSRRRIRGVETLYRVGIRHDGLGTIDNVSVELEDMVPSVLPAHLLLHQMHDNTPPGVNRQDFSLDADQTVFIDVVLKHDDNGQPPSDQVIIWHIVPGVSLHVPAQRYEVVILAHGRNVMAARRNFIIDVDTVGALQFERDTSCS